MQQVPLPSSTGGSLEPDVSEPRFAEDLPALAAQSYVLAGQHCQHCRNFHSLWPYLRIARMCGAAESGQVAIEQTLTDLMVRGARRVLIAGAADTGLLATVARATEGHEVEITIVDQCITPLELCRRFAEHWSLRVETGVCDLAQLAVRDFDIVYANSVLQFIMPESRVDVLARLHDALRPGGHLVHVFNAGSRVGGGVLPEYRDGYSKWLLAELDRRGVGLPDSRTVLRRIANEYSRERETREGTFESPDVVDAMTRAAGFDIVDRQQLTMTLASPYQTFVAKLSKQRFLTLAQSPRT